MLPCRWVRIIDAHGLQAIYGWLSCSRYIIFDNLGVQLYERTGSEGQQNAPMSALHPTQVLTNILNKQPQHSATNNRKPPTSTNRAAGMPEAASGSLWQEILLEVTSPCKLCWLKMCQVELLRLLRGEPPTVNSSFGNGVNHYYLTNTCIITVTRTSRLMRIC